MLRGRIGDVLPCRRKGTTGLRRGLSTEVARVWVKRGINCLLAVALSLGRVAGSVLDRGRSKSCSRPLPLLKRRCCVNGWLQPLNVSARRSWLGELGSSFLISPFLSEAQNASLLSNITWSVAKSLVVPSGGNSHSCNCAGSPCDPSLSSELVCLDMSDSLENSTHVACIPPSWFSSICSVCLMCPERSQQVLQPPHFHRRHFSLG